MRLAKLCRVALALLYFLISTASYSQDMESKCDSPFRIYFGNGIQNSDIDWDASREALRSLVGDTYHGIPVSYGNAINPTGGMLDDLRRVYEQKISENPNLNWELLSRVYLGIAEGYDPTLVSLVSDLIKQVSSSTNAQILKKFEENYTYVDDKVMQHVSAFTEDIVNHGRRVLLVGHSQGNLYANAAHRLLYGNEKIEPGNFSVVGIASPAGFVAGNGPYLTSNSDLVISALHSVVQTLPPNIEIPFHLEDVSGHNFLATYMNVAYPGVSKISATVKSNLAMLEPPKSTYDYSINMSIVSMSTSPTDQTLDAIYPLRFCNIDPIIFLWYKCVRPNFIAYIKNDAGLGFDPDRSPEFSTIANAALNRIIRFAPEAAEATVGTGHQIMMST